MTTSNERVNMVAICTAREGCSLELRALLETFVTITRQEPGCLSYVLHAELDQPGRFVFYEAWENQSALDEHFERPEIIALIEKLEPLLDDPAELLRLAVLC